MVSPARALSRAVKTMRAPFSASLMAATSPIPEVAPVMTTVLPCMKKRPRSQDRGLIAFAWGVVPLPDDVQVSKEEPNFIGRRLRGIRTVYRIGFDRFG